MLQQRAHKPWPHLSQQLPAPSLAIWAEVGEQLGGKVGPLLRLLCTAAPQLPHPTRRRSKAAVTRQPPTAGQGRHGRCGVRNASRAAARLRPCRVDARGLRREGAEAAAAWPGSRKKGDTGSPGFPLTATTRSQVPIDWWALCRTVCSVHFRTRAALQE